MSVKKHYIFSARTTEEGLRALNELKAERGVGWDELVIEVRKNNGIGSSPQDVQAFLQFEDDCGGGGGGDPCCPPSYLHQNQWDAYGYSYLSTQPDALDLDASVCGQGPITAEVRPSVFAPGGIPPTVLSADVDPVLNVARVTWDNDGTDGRFVLEITNACGCCWLFPIEGFSL